MTDQPETKPRVGLGVMILKDGKVLLGKRKGAHGAGDWSFPGGHLEYMEGFEECVRRETKEECGIEIKDIRFLCVGNLKIYAPRHYIHVGFSAEWKEGEPKIMEPDKCEGWEWFSLSELPKPLFHASEMMIESYKTGKTYRDIE